MGALIRSSLSLTFVLLLIGTTSLFAQTGAVSGRVTDSGTGAPLAGARVELINVEGRVASHTTTDGEGQYRLANVQGGTYSLSVTLLGYETRRIDEVRIVAGQTSLLAVSLDVSVLALNPIVVSASKRQEKVIDAPASVAVVDSRAISERPTTTPVDHLKSVPGVDIMSSGVQSTNVVVRGFNNVFSGALHALTDNRIAGVPSLRFNALHFIPSNNDDIERMEVVLGPGAALYGPNTSNGVLHIVTKSPIDAPGSSFSVAGGERSLFQGQFRVARRVNDQFGIKLSGQYIQAEEWGYTDKVEADEKEKFLNDSTGFYKTDLMRAAGIDEAEADRRIARIGNRDFDIQRWGLEARADYRPNNESSVILSAGMSQTNGIELTGLGAGQAVDWSSSYVQARGNWNRLFVQGYLNASNAGETYLLRNGTPITDKSKLYVGQLQHGFDLGERQSFTYGLDLLYTDPVTGGTINGKYEDDDQTTEFGVYLQSETVLHPKLNLVVAGRLDNHSALPENVFSPRAALVFKPTEEQAFRLTFNRAFSTPSSLNQFLDLGSALPEQQLAELGYSLRVQGTGKHGFSFLHNGGYQMRSPFNFMTGGSNADLLDANAATVFNRAILVVANQLEQSGALNDPQMAQLIGYLKTLQPTDQEMLAFLDLNNPAAGPQPFSSFGLSNLDPIRESTTTTIEVGYKGVIGNRLLLAADIWYSQKENMVTPLMIQTPLIMLSGAETGAYLTQKFMTELGMDQATAVATATQLTEALARIPVGVISSPDVNANGAQVLTTYINVDDRFDLYGADISATALLNQNWTLSGSLSLVNENVFETKKGESVTLNAPKRKGSISLGYRSSGNRLNAELRARYNESFPVRSGVYNGTLCIGGTEAGAEDCVDSSTLMDFLLGYSLPFQGASLQLSVQNALNEKYRSFPGVPEIGRMAVLRLKYDF